MTTFLGLESPVAIAHRGGAAEHPENSMIAFEHAVNLGYRCVDTDVRATRDGVAMVFHDENLDRLTDHTGPLVARDWAQLDDVRIAGKEPIVRLDDLLGAWPDIRLIIDPKSDDVVTPLIEVLRRTNARDRVCVGSFSARRLRRIRAESPGWTSCSPPRRCGFVRRPGASQRASWLPTARKCRRVTRSSEACRSPSSMQRSFAPPTPAGCLCKSGR